MNEDKRQQGFEPQKIEVETNEEGNDGTKKIVKVSMDTEDIIAIFAGLVAAIIALGMVFGAIPVNALTVSILTFTGIGTAIAKIIGARKKKNRK